MFTQDAIDSFIRSRNAKGLSQTTITWYKGILKEFSRYYSVLPDKPELIEVFLMQCTHGGDERRHGYYRALRVLYNFIERRHGEPNPLHLIDAPKRQKKIPRFLTPEELYQLLTYPHIPKIKTALYFLADTGARIGELANLNLDNLTYTEHAYIAQINGKTGYRLVPISAVTYSLLSKNLPWGYSKFRLRRLISQAFKDAGIPGTAHSLRHTFGTLWRGDELVLQQILGHAHISTTKIYRSLRLETIIEQHSVNSPLQKVLGFTQKMEL